MKRFNAVFLLCVIWLVLLCLNIAAQTSAFTYQGRLNDTGTPTTGLYDFQFKLFDALTGGNQVGGVQLNSVSVTSGVFNVTLDFGAAAFPGTARFLDISVRLAGGGAFTPLTPRRPINSVPYGVRSLNATSADSLSAACTSCVTDAQIAAVAGSKITGAIPAASVPTGSGNYIQNTTTAQTNSNFNISGNGTAGGTLSGNIVNATTQFNLNGNRILSNPGANNTFVGVSAGVALATGDRNSFFGYGAGNANSTGTRNSFFGSLAGASNTTSIANSFFGQQAGTANTTGSNNSFFGDAAGQANTTGNGNSFFGYVAGGANVNGNSNSFFGYGAGAANLSGNNAYFGYLAGTASTTSCCNAFFGANAGLKNTTGSDNAFFGSEAGETNTTGSSNAFFGGTAGLLNTTGFSNAFFGFAAGRSNTTGDSNTFFGFNTGYGNTTASGNSYFGTGAGNNTSTGNNNTFIGYNAGNTNTTGVNNTALGFFTNFGQANLANATAVGYRAQVNCSNCVVLGGVSGVNGATTAVSVGIGTASPQEALHVRGGDIRVGVGNTGCLKNDNGVQIIGACSSDIRFKRDITPFANILPKLAQLQPVHFYWRAAEFPDKHFGDDQAYGLIAQEVEQVLPELVLQDAHGYRLVNYGKLPLLTLQAIKELKAENDTLKTQNAHLHEQTEALKKANAAIEARLAALEKLLQQAAPVKKEQ